MTKIITKLFCVLVLTFVVSGSPQAQTIHISHCLAGCPVGASANNDLIVRNLYAISINSQTRVADWAAYRLIPGTVGVASLLPREWQAEPLLDDGLQPLELVEGSGETGQAVQINDQELSYRVNEFTLNSADRGRLVPMSSFAGTPYWPDLNLLSNMAALTNDMRLGPWSRLDQSINQLVGDRDELFVITGPIYQIERALSEASSSINSLPSAFFKLVANLDGQVSVFVFAQDLQPHVRYCDQRSELDEVERLTGLKFFPAQAHWPLGSLDQKLGC